MSNGYNAILAIIDRYSKYVLALPTNMELTSFGTAQLYCDQIWTKFSLPRTVISDQGPQFTAQFMRDLYKLMGVQTNLSMAYIPKQTDRQSVSVRRWISTFKSSLKSARLIGVSGFLSLLFPTTTGSNCQQGSLHFT